MTPKKKSPPAATGGAPKLISLATIGSKNTTPSLDLQHLRVAHLARRFPLAATIATAVATLAYGEARG